LGLSLVKTSVITTTELLIVDYNVLVQRKRSMYNEKKGFI